MVSFWIVPVEAEDAAADVVATEDVEFSWMYLTSFAKAANCLSSYELRDFVAVSLAFGFPDSASRSLHPSCSSTQKSNASVRCFRASSHAAGVE